MIHTLTNKIRKRKTKLNTYLTNNKDELNPEKHHQIKGALDEMNHMLNLLSQYKKQEIHQENNPKDEVFLLKPIDSAKKPFNVVDFVKGLF